MFLVWFWKVFKLVSGRIFESKLAGATKILETGTAGQPLLLNAERARSRVGSSALAVQSTARQ